VTRRPLGKQVYKYQHVVDKLSGEIRSGKYKTGDRIPSEAALVKRFGISRITVGRALRELSQQGLVERIAGSGSYVREGRTADGLLFGLLIADLGRTEIFEPICQGIASAAQSGRHVLIWGNIDTPDRRALDLCDQYVERQAAGVFFAPLEGTDDATEMNLTIAARLERAGIPIVLLDRCILPYPKRSPHDLVGIDNRRAGFLAASHLLNLGAQQVSFLARTRSAPTVDARIAGCREALIAHGAPPEKAQVFRLESITPATVATAIEGSRKGDGFVCANDRTAGEFLHALIALGRKTPEDFRVVGIDDVEYASLLPVPLTTIHQPCRDIGEAAVGLMLDRIRHPNMAVRDLLLESKLVIRESCGASLHSR
jgi:GntR family transcriptional regulator, arabinose operon transcriptional repressor